MKKIISETIDGSMKDILQLKTVDNSLEYAQLFDALEDCPDDFKSKLIGALNSLSQTMGISPDSVFDKVLCASDDEQEKKKKLYNWWRAVFEVVSKSVSNIPEDRRQEYEEKLDALISEICKSGDAHQGEENEVVLEDYEAADLQDEKEMLDDMQFAISKLGEVAKKVQELVNFVNPYCESVGGKEDIMNENEADSLGAKDISKLIWDSQDDEMEVLESYPPNKDGRVKFDVFIKNNGQLGEHVSIDDIVGLAEGVFDSILRGTGWEFEVVPANEDNIVEMWNGADFDGKVDVYNDQTRLGDSDGATFQITCIKANGQFNEVDNTMKKLNERGGSDWVSMDDIVGMEVGESDDDTINWDDEDSYNDGGFERGMWVIWTDPDSGEESVWKILEMPKGEDDYFVLGQKDGSINEVPGWEIRPRDSDPEEYKGDNDDVMEGSVDQLDEYEFLEKMLDDAEDTNDVFDVYDGNVIEDGTVALNVTVYKYDVEDGEVEAEFKDMPLKYGWEYECFRYSSDLPGEDGTETIVVYFRPMKKHVNEEISKMENELKKGDDGWREIGQTVGEAKVTVDANDVWDVLDLLSDETANKNLTDLINSHTRSEEEIMDAIENLLGEFGYSDGVPKEALNGMFSAENIGDLIEELGLDVEAFMNKGEFVDPQKPVALEGSEGDEQKPDEVKSGEKKYKQDGETKTLVTGEDDNKSVVSEMTIEQEINDPWKLLNLLWGQGKDNFDELLSSNLFSDDRIMDTLEQFEVRDLTNLNDLLAYDFEQVLEALGCDVDAWTQRLEIQMA